ncbi:MAG: hypothetical protein P8P30_04870 [Rickettsiales bacterium]|nr:hypothetical protein [Rickettsiales bacterium]
MRRILLFCLILLTPLMAAASDPVILAPSLAMNCALTPTMTGADESYPGKGKVEKSNKLSHAAGKAVIAEGERLFFMGKVLDERCMPVEGAHIELWQANTNGQYKWATKGQLMAPSAAFTGSGTAITNNLGEFQFDTIFPGPYADRAPHFNVRITHPDLVPLTTEIFFRNDRRNVWDPKVKGLAPDLRDRLLAVIHAREVTPTPHGLRAYIEIVLRGKEKFSQY